MKSKKTEERNPWLWIPSLYLAVGLPYVVVMTVGKLLLMDDEEMVRHNFGLILNNLG